jgi:hypothetical protein
MAPRNHRNPKPVADDAMKIENEELRNENEALERNIRAMERVAREFRLKGMIKERQEQRGATGDDEVVDEVAGNTGDVMERLAVLERTVEDNSQKLDSNSQKLHINNELLMKLIAEKPRLMEEIDNDDSD